jgi:hypothetical protein
MIKELLIENIEIEDTENSFAINNISGKVLKILYKPTKENDSKITFKLFTKEGEQIVNISDEGVYYPRANVSSQKMEVDSVDMSGDKTDYYYFYQKLFFNFVSDSPVNGKVVDRITIIYEE